jgi:RNA polymerase sigma-70 factor (ECF subfamily)
LKESNKKLLIAFMSKRDPTPLESAASFSELYERTHLSVFHYLYGLTGGNQQDAEDLAAETFTRAWKARKTFQGDAEAALGWLLKISRRLAIDDHRKRSSRPGWNDEIPEEMPYEVQPTEELVSRREDEKRLRSLLGILSIGQKELVALRYLLGWKVNKIADYLEVSENFISVNLHRIIERLRQQWLQLEEK